MKRIKKPGNYVRDYHSLDRSNKLKDTDAYLRFMYGGKQVCFTIVNFPFVACNETQRLLFDMINMYLKESLNIDKCISSVVNAPHLYRSFYCNFNKNVFSKDEAYSIVDILHDFVIDPEKKISKHNIHYAKYLNFNGSYEQLQFQKLCEIANYKIWG